MPRSVYIVEDESDIAELYVDMLELGGHTVVGIAADGQEAVERFARLEHRPDVIIMDYRIPIKNGIEAAREILEIDPDARFIFATADRSVETEAEQLGVRVFLSKPFNLDILLEKIDMA